MEKEYRYIYNPYLLNLIYQKVIHQSILERIISFFIYNRNDIYCKLSIEEKYHLIRENLYDAQIISDIYHLLERMKTTTFHFDLYYCNYEAILTRLFLHTMDPIKKEKLPFQLEEVNLGERFLCEEKMSSFMNENERYILHDISLKYIFKFYSSSLVNYESESVKRASLLFNIKKSAEHKVLPRHSDDDYAIEYNLEVVMTMMYLFLMNEFQSLLADDKSLLTHRHLTSTYSHQDDKSLAARKLSDELRELDNKISLMTQLSQMLDDYIYTQLSGPLICCCPKGIPTKACETTQFYLDPPLDTERMERKLVDKRNGQFMLKTKSVKHLHYIRLTKNRHIYQYITRRFILDHEIRLSHREKCPFKEKTKDSPYTIDCQICHYFIPLQRLTEFYNNSENCFYINASEEIEGNYKRCIEKYLGGFLLDKTESLDSIIYKNAWQMMKLFSSNESNHQSLNLDIFYIINIREMIQYITTNFEQFTGEAEYRVNKILEDAKKKSGSFSKVEQWQKSLALDQDVFLQIYASIGKQMNRIQSYERTILPINTLIKGTGKVSVEINLIMSNILLLYQEILLSTMKK